MTMVGLVLAWLGLSPAEAQEKPRDLIHAYRVWKLTDVLDLSDEQMYAFFARLREIDDKEADLIEQERRAVRELADLLAREEAAERDLREVLERHEEIRTKHAEEIRRIRSEAMELLDLRQRCKYVVFEHRFRDELRGLIQRAKELREERLMERRPKR
jgi:hypothetical protein